MRLVRIGVAGALAAAAAACGQGGGNVMTATGANSLTEEQVDLALGNEASNDTNTAAGNAIDKPGSNSSEE